MKAVRIALAGRERHLAFTVEAMFQLEERFGGVQELIEAVSANSREGFQAACQAASVLAEQGELARRHMGYDSAPIPSAEEIAATTAPSGITALKMAVTSAVTLGFGREIEPDSDEVDIGLAELNEQKKNSVKRAHFLRMGMACGFSRKETLLASPGEISDAWELYLQAHGVKKKREDE